MTIYLGLLPPETPPALRRIRRRKFPGLMGLDPVEDVISTNAKNMKRPYSNYPFRIQ